MRPLKRLLPLLLVLLAGCATTAPKPEAAAATAPAAQRDFMWEAVPPGGGKPVMLLGSVHLGRSGALAFSPEVESAFKASEGLVVEVDVGKLDPAQMKQLVERYGVTPEGEDLFSHLAPETATAVRMVLSQHGIPEAAVARMRPWLLALTLSTAEMQRLGWNPDDGVDKRLLDRARGTKEIVALETMEDQMVALSTFEGDEEDLYMRDSIRELGQLGPESEQMETAWRTGDTATIDRLIHEGVALEPRLKPIYERMIDRRNVGMAANIAALPTDKRWFVTVGAGHLVGAQGIPALLQAKGWKVKQVER